MHIHRPNFKYNSGDMGIPLHLLAEFHENQLKKLSFINYVISNGQQLCEVWKQVLFIPFYTRGD